MPDRVAGSAAIYPGQVSVDLTDGSVIGRTALYDPSTPIDVIRASIDERYGKWSMQEFKSGPMMIWRVVLEKFAINLSTNENGMIMVIYLTFGAKHPASPAVHACGG
jgi:hypothetical protein